MGNLRAFLPYVLSSSYIPRRQGWREAKQRSLCAWGTIHCSNRLGLSHSRTLICKFATPSSLSTASRNKLEYYYSFIFIPRMVVRDMFVCLVSSPKPELWEIVWMFEAGRQYGSHHALASLSQSILSHKEIIQDCSQDTITHNYPWSNFTTLSNLLKQEAITIWGINRLIVAYPCVQLHTLIILTSYLKHLWLLLFL